MKLDKRMNRAIEELRNVSVPKTVGRRRKLRRLTFIGVGIVGSSAISIALLWPRPASAAGIEEMRQALRDVPACHSINNLGQEFWQEGEKRRYLKPNEIDRAFDGEFTWTYSIQEAVLRKSIESPEGYGMPMGFVEDIANDFLKYKLPRPKISSRYDQRNGAQRWIAILEWTTKENGVDVKAEFECDPASKLPDRLQYIIREPGKSWRRAARFEFDYPADIPDEMFVLKAKPGVTLIDITDRKNIKTYASKIERAPFPPNCGLRFGSIYVNRSPQGGKTKGKPEYAFSASAFRFHANGTVDMWIQLGPITNVYYLGGTELELALHGWKSAKDIPIKDWPGTKIDLMPGEWMQVRKGANAIIENGFVRVASESGRTQYTKLVHSPSTEPRIEIMPKGIRTSQHDGYIQYVANAVGDLPK